MDYIKIDLSKVVRVRLIPSYLNPRYSWLPKKWSWWNLGYFDEGYYWGNDYSNFCYYGKDPQKLLGRLGREYFLGEDGKEIREMSFIEIETDSHSISILPRKTEEETLLEWERITNGNPNTGILIIQANEYFNFSEL